MWLSLSVFENKAHKMVNLHHIKDHSWGYKSVFFSGKCLCYVIYDSLCCVIVYNSIMIRSLQLCWRAASLMTRCDVGTAALWQHNFCELQNSPWGLILKICVAVWSWKVELKFLCLIKSSNLRNIEAAPSLNLFLVQKPTQSMFLFSHCHITPWKHTDYFHCELHWDGNYTWCEATPWIYLLKFWFYST